jgi:type III secretion system YscD/HrpQ family protein
MGQRDTGTLFRLLSGFNSSAEMELVPGDWILGSDDESQLVLLDAGIQPRHVLLRVDENGGLTLVPLNGSVELGGETLPPEGAAVPPRLVFSLGGVLAAHGPCDSPWTAQEPPSPGEASSAPPAASANENAEAPPAGPAAASPGGASAGEQQTPSPQPEENAGPEQAAPSSPGKRRTWLLRAALLIALGALLVEFPEIQKMFSDSGRAAERLEQDLRARGFSGIRVTAADDGKTRIQGAVATNARLEDLARYVEGLAPRPDLDVASLEDIVDALRAGARRADAAVEFFRSGASLRITGYAYDQETLAALLQEAGGIPDGVSVRSDVLFWDRAEPELRSLLAANGLESASRLVPDKYRVNLRLRRLSGDEQRRLRRFLLASGDMFGVERTVVPVIQTGERPRPVPAPPSGPVPVEEKNSEIFSCSELRLAGRGESLHVFRDGQAYGIGAKMPDGLRVRSIHPAYVVLQQDDHVRVCADTEMTKE